MTGYPPEVIMANESAIAASKAHTPRLVLSEHVNKLVHGDNALGRLNTRIALAVTKAVGSMWCAYAFGLLALISLPGALATHQALIIVSWIAQTFLQLVLLPIIIVGQNVQAAASDARAESDHETLLSIHTLTAEVHRLNERETQILELLADRVKG